MAFWQQAIITIILFISILGNYSFILNLKHKKSQFSNINPIFNIIGAFVMADLFVFAPFWFFVGIITYLLQNWLLFLFIFFTFWLIRSIGETFYWISQQFNPRKGNDPEKFFVHNFVKGEAVWVVLQIFWQCMAVLSATAVLYVMKHFLVIN